VIKETIGINAGLIWQALENGGLNVKAVKKAGAWVFPSPVAVKHLIKSAKLYDL